MWHGVSAAERLSLALQSLRDLLTNCKCWKNQVHVAGFLPFQMAFSL
jgi:hypothetical protein